MLAAMDLLSGELSSACGFKDVGFEFSIGVLHRTHHKSGYFSFLEVSLFKKPSSCLSVCSSVQMTLLPSIGLRRKKSCVTEWEQCQLKSPENRLVISAATNTCEQAGSSHTAETEPHFLSRNTLLDQAPKHLCRAAGGDSVQPVPNQDPCTDTLCSGLYACWSAIQWHLTCLLISSLLRKIIFSCPREW